MDVLTAIKSRRSVRSYKPDPVSDQLIEQILDAARWAPSGGNQQFWRFIVVKDEGIRKVLKLLSAGLFADPPVIVVVCIEKGSSPSQFVERARDLRIQGAAAAIQNMLLAAHALGLGACWIGASSWREVTSLLEIPYEVEPLSLVALGYTSESPPPPPRRPLNEIAYIDTYRNRWSK